MGPIVDLTNLREMTDGDAELEKTLFEEFFSSCKAGIITLQNNHGIDTEEQWRTQAHALKGIALSLGANKLGELCKKAQDDHQATPTDKEKMLHNIQTEYAQVEAFLLKAMTHSSL